MKIMVISGSPRQESLTTSVSEQVVELLKKKGMDIEVFDVSKELLPLYKDSAEDEKLAVVQKLVNMSSLADAFFILTPEYHNGMSGALKNALDFLSKQQFKNKPAAIVATTSNSKGGMNALINLRLVMRGLLAFVLPDQTVIEWKDIEDANHTSHSDGIDRLNNMIDHLVSLTCLTSQKAMSV